MFRRFYVAHRRDGAMSNLTGKWYPKPCPYIWLGFSKRFFPEFEAFRDRGRGRLIARPVLDRAVAEFIQTFTWREAGKLRRRGDSMWDIPTSTIVEGRLPDFLRAKDVEDHFESKVRLLFRYRVRSDKLPNDADVPSDSDDDRPWVLCDHFLCQEIGEPVLSIK
jgi:hypothetical protein